MVARWAWAASVAPGPKGRERSYRPSSLYPHANGQRALLSGGGFIGLGRYPALEQQPAMCRSARFPSVCVIARDLALVGSGLGLGCSYSLGGSKSRRPCLDGTTQDLSATPSPRPAHPRMGRRGSSDFGRQSSASLTSLFHTRKGGTPTLRRVRQANPKSVLAADAPEYTKSADRHPGVRLGLATGSPLGEGAITADL